MDAPLDHLGLRAVLDAVQRDHDLSQATPDPARPYGRRVLWAHAGVEVMLATWTRGRWCAPHDHGGALGVVRVLAGRGQHRRWSLAAGSLRITSTEPLVAGAELCCDATLIHSMGDDDGDVPLRTLHAYAPSLPSMTVYDLEATRTLDVDGNCGAWVPSLDRIRSARAGFHPR